MTCVPTCVQPSPSNAHCGACHVTWSGIRGFDRHRRDGACLTPAEIGFVATTRNDGGTVYGSPSTEAGRARLAALRSRQSDETGSVVPRDTPGDSEACVEPL